jgi:hypothetical protein
MLDENRCNEWTGLGRQYGFTMGSNIHEAVDGHMHLAEMMTVSALR